MHDCVNISEKIRMYSAAVIYRHNPAG